MNKGKRVLKDLLCMILSMTLSYGIIYGLYRIEMNRNVSDFAEECLNDIDYTELRMMVEESMIIDEVAEHYHNEPLRDYIVSQCRVDNALAAYFNSRNKNSSEYQRAISSMNNQLEEIIYQECDYIVEIRKKYKNTFVQLD